jgi:hypothetical protein
LFVGESFTEELGVTRGDTFAARREDRASLRGRQDDRLHVDAGWRPLEVARGRGDLAAGHPTPGADLGDAGRGAERAAAAW